MIIKPPPEASEEGFSLIEMMVTLAIFSVLVGSLFSIVTESGDFTGNSDADAAVQEEATRAFTRLSQELRKSGWNTDAGTSYPRLLKNRSVLEFKKLTDLDGNGYRFDNVSGELEWSPRVFSVKRDAQDNVLAIHENGVPVWHLGRFIENVDFASYLEDSSLLLQEIRVTITARKLTKKGEPITYTVTGSIFMRN